MIYIKNNTEIQTIFIPRNELQKEAYIASTKTYEDGYRDGLEDGKEQQKDKLLNLYVTENGQYEREDGWNVVTVDVPDLNGSYEEGYEQGKTDGINEQKDKLESINITENGVYSKEDGYNHIEVNVPSYEEGQADMAAKARVLEVTENGTYLSKFSDPIMPTVTGVYADGTEFYNYAYLKNIQYNTNIYPMSNTVMEIWWKYDGTMEEREGCIIGCQNWGYANSIFKIGWNFADNKLLASINDDTIFIPFIEGWNHIVMSYADGLWLNGVKIGTFPSNITDDMDNKEPICINGYYGNNRMNSDYFGMVKINDVVIIPTANGFSNINTGELLEVVKNGDYTYTENLPTYGEGELYKTINVNVPDLNGSYDEGKTDGINEQKSKLETINITENGTYNREDGYNKIIVKVPDLNGSYDEGYDQGQADIAENAKVLNVTENGVYKTKFSDPIIPTVTGVYADGTEFYNYADLEGISYDSGFIVSKDMEVEIWWKGDVSKTDKNLFGSQVNNFNAIFKIRIPDTAYRFDGEIAMRQVTYLNAESNRWYHFKMSYADGFWADGVKIGDFSRNISGTPDKLYINSNTPYSFNGANGYFGMIKITTNGVENIIIPTAEGLKNITTNEMLQVVQDGTYTFTKNLPTYGEGEIYKTINVNVPQEAVSCNLEDKQVTPSMNDRDGNGFIVVSPSEGYDGLSRTVIGPQTIYNEGVEAGKTEKETDIAENARVLNVTENGVYRTKFSDPIIPANYTVTGVYADGTNFYSYAELNGKVFNTKIAGSVDSRLEFWYKGDNQKTGDAWNVIIGSGDIDNSDCFQVRYFISFNNQLRIEVGNSTINVSNWDDTVWHHLIVSKAEGLWIDGEKKGDFSPSNTINGEFFINGIGYVNNGIGDGLRNANGTFGMVKIDDVVFIPTTNGFQNVNTGELLEVVKNGTYTFTENLPIYSEGELYKTINVNVPSVQDEALQYDTIAFSYTVYNWSNHNINRDNMTTNCGDRPLDCLLFRNRSGECTVMTKLDNCSGTAQLENGWTEDNIIRTLKSKTITKFLSNSINSNQLTSIDTGLAQLKENAIINCNALTDIKLAILNNNLSVQFASNCFNGLPAEGTITIGKTADVTLTDDEITSFFRAIVGEGWTITIK